MQLRSQFRQPVSPHLRGLFGKNVAPDGAILHWDASQGWQDQTGNQSLTLIGSAYPNVTASGAVNAIGHEWGFDLGSGAVRTAFLAGQATIVMQVTMPLMSSLTDATDYSLWGDLLFVRRDGSVGTFRLKDGTNTASVEYDWDEGEVVTVVCQKIDVGVGFLMRVRIFGV